MELTQYLPREQQAGVLVNLQPHDVEVGVGQLRRVVLDETYNSVSRPLHGLKGREGPTVACSWTARVSIRSTCVVSTCS